jgi:plasmid stability protein
MAQLRIRNLEPELIEELKRLAQSNGRTLEEEIYERLRAALEEDDKKAADSAKR